MALLTRPRWLWRILLALPAVACWVGATLPPGTDAEAAVGAVEAGQCIIEVFDRCIVVGPIPVANLAPPEPKAAQPPEQAVDSEDDTTVPPVLPPPVDAELIPFVIEFREVVVCNVFLSADPSTAAEVSLRLTTFLARYNGWATSSGSGPSRVHCRRPRSNRRCTWSYQGSLDVLPPASMAIMKA